MPKQLTRFCLLASVALSALAPTGCDGSSTPTQPSGPPPGATGLALVILDPNGLLAPHEELIRELVEATYERVRGQIPVDPVTIEVAADNGLAIPGYGVGGEARVPYRARIGINVDFPDVVELLPARLPVIVAHELHHNARWRGPGYGSTLLESMVSEGLADRFAVELLQAPVPPWSRAFPEADTEGYLARARPLLDSRTFNHSVWFFGTGDLPNWTGYTLGYRLVERYQLANPGRSAADLVHTSANVFRP